MLTVSVVAWFNRNSPDPAQESQGDGYSKPMLQALSAVCVRSPDYGTRSVSFFPPWMCQFPPTAVFSLGWVVGVWSYGDGTQNSPVESILHRGNERGSSAWWICRYRECLLAERSKSYDTLSAHSSFRLSSASVLSPSLCSKLYYIRNDTFSLTH